MNESVGGDTITVNMILDPKFAFKNVPEQLRSVLDFRVSPISATGISGTLGNESIGIEAAQSASR